MIQQTPVGPLNQHHDPPATLRPARAPRTRSPLPGSGRRRHTATPRLPTCAPPPSQVSGSAWGAPSSWPPEAMGSPAVGGAALWRRRGCLGPGVDATGRSGEQLPVRTRVLTLLPGSLSPPDVNVTLKGEAVRLIDPTAGAAAAAADGGGGGDGEAPAAKTVASAASGEWNEAQELALVKASAPRVRPACPEGGGPARYSQPPLSACPLTFPPFPHAYTHTNMRE